MVFMEADLLFLFCLAGDASSYHDGWLKSTVPRWTPVATFD